MDAGTADTQEHAQVPGSPSWTLKTKIFVSLSSLCIISQEQEKAGQENIKLKTFSRLSRYQWRKNTFKVVPIAFLRQVSAVVYKINGCLFLFLLYFRPRIP